MASTKGQVITCKAAVCWGLGGPVRVETIQVDPPKAFEIRVKMITATICHTDALSIDGFPAAIYPKVLGHEGVGVIESVGHGVRDFVVGDRVITASYGECGSCRSCVSKRTNFCLTYPASLTLLMADGTTRFSITDPKTGKRTQVYNFLNCSTWTEYMVVNMNYATKVNDYNLDPAHASILSCAFTAGYGATTIDAKIKAGESVAIFGLGPVGLSVVQVAKMRGATKIIGIDKNVHRREVGKKLGLTHFINSEGPLDQPLWKIIRDMTDGGADATFECSGHDAFMNESMKAAVPGKGKTVICGAGNYPDGKISFDFTQLLFGGHVEGNIYGRVRIKSDLPGILEQARLGAFDLDTLLTHRVSLKDISFALDHVVPRADCIKTVIEISDPSLATTGPGDVSPGAYTPVESDEEA